jgi:uncharacterized protein (TIGR00730 family)
MRLPYLNRMKSVVVFCGSADGYNEAYKEAAYELGAILAERNIELIYGGARVGLMGTIAEGVLTNGGTVTGVIPEFLMKREVVHDGLTRLITVESMHERKLKMHELSDGIIAMPGGWGTLEELLEMMTWAQLGLHQKPIALLNVAGYYDAFRAMIGLMVDEGFLKEEWGEILLVSPDPIELLELMRHYEPPMVARFIKKDEL